MNFSFLVFCLIYVWPVTEMMFAIGSIKPFDRKLGQFGSYVERLEQYFVVNSIVEAKQKLVFLTFIGSDTCEVLRNLVSSKKLKDGSYETSMQLLTKHLCP